MKNEKEKKPTKVPTWLAILIILITAYVFAHIAMAIAAHFSNN